VLRQLPSEDALAVIDGREQRPGFDYGVSEQEDHGPAAVARARAQQRDRQRFDATTRRRDGDDRRHCRHLRRFLLVITQPTPMNIYCQLLTAYSRSHSATEPRDIKKKCSRVKVKKCICKEKVF